MRDESGREFERIVGDSHALPGAGRYWRWVACPVVLALAAGAALYPIVLPAFVFSLNEVAAVFEGVAQVIGFAVLGDPGVLSGSASGWHAYELPPPQSAFARGLSAAGGAVVGVTLAAVVEDFVPRWTASARGYEDGMRLTRWLPYVAFLLAVAAHAAWGRVGA